MRSKLHRFKSLAPLGIGSSGSHFFFELLLMESDALEQTHQYSNDHQSGAIISFPFSGEAFPLRLSREHTGFCFVQDLLHAADLTYRHAAGHSSSALLQYCERLKRLECETVSPEPVHSSKLICSSGADHDVASEKAVTRESNETVAPHHSSEVLSFYTKVFICFRGITSFCSRLFQLNAAQNHINH